MLILKRLLVALFCISAASACGGSDSAIDGGSNVEAASNSSTEIDTLETEAPSGGGLDENDNAVDATTDSSTIEPVAADVDTVVDSATGAEVRDFTITRISLGADGRELNDDIGQFQGTSSIEVSDDGILVAFSTRASNVIGDVQGNVRDIYFRNTVTNEIRKISIGANGEGLDNDSFLSDMTPDGRYILFSSNATNVVSPGTNGASQTYLHDTLTQETLLVSQNAFGQAGDSDSFGSDISADGNLIAYLSFATNLVENDLNEVSDIFIFDVEQMTTISPTVQAFDGFERRSVGADLTSDGTMLLLSIGESFSGGSGITVVHNLSSGESTELNFDFGGNSDAVQKVISDNGQYIGYSDRFGAVEVSDIQVNRLNIVTGDLEVASIDTPNGGNFDAEISPTGQFMIYQNLATGEVYLRDFDALATTLISVGLNGELADGDSGGAKFSRNGQFVSFRSSATNLVSDDNNFRQDGFLYQLNP